MGVVRPLRLGAAAVASAGVVMSGVSLTPVHAASVSYGNVTATTAVHIRTSATTSSSILGVLYRGQHLRQVGPNVHGWTPVTYRGHQAFVYSKYLTGVVGGSTTAPARRAPSVASSPAGTARSTTYLNVRSGASTSYAKVGLLRPGQSVSLTGLTVNGFSEIIHNGAHRWVASRYLSASVTASSPSSSTPSRGSSLPAVSGQARGTTALMLRTSYTNHFNSEGDAPTGTIFNLTGKRANGNAQIIWKGRIRWVNARYLAPLDAPKTPSRPSAPSLPAVTGQARGTTALMLRTSYTNHFNSEGDAPTGTIFNLTGKRANGNAQIIWKGRIRWVNARYLAPVGSSAPAETPKVVGTRYATVALDIRTASGWSSRTVGEVPAGTALSITGTQANGRAEIVYDGQVRWVTARYLSSSQPSSSSTATASTGSSWDALVAGGSSGLSGLRPSSRRIVDDVVAHFPQIRTVYGVRADSIADHPSGHAVDLMLPGANQAERDVIGWQIANYYREHADELGVQYIIFHQKIWNKARDAEGWRMMSDRGGLTANHMDHVHITSIWD